MDPVKPAGNCPVDLPLGLLPEREGQPRIYTATGPVPEAGHWYSPAAVRELQAAERERCAAWVDARRDAFCEGHGSIDPDTGTLEFGRGAHAEAKSEYVGELEEIAAGLRALRA